MTNINNTKSFNPFIWIIISYVSMKIRSNRRSRTQTLKFIFSNPFINIQRTCQETDIQYLFLFIISDFINIRRVHFYHLNVTTHSLLSSFHQIFDFATMLPVCHIATDYYPVFSSNNLPHPGLNFSLHFQAYKIVSVKGS